MQEYKDFNEKFHQAREDEAQELVIKDIGKDIKNEQILALLQIHDTYVGEEPKVDKSKWGVLKNNSKNETKGAVHSHVISHVLQRYQSQLEIQVKSKGKGILFDKYVNKKEEALEELSKKSRMDLVQIDTSKDYIVELEKFFRKRNARKKRG